MSSKKVEGIAVNKVNDLVYQSKTLEPYFDKNDKTPSWDGSIFVFSTDNGQKRDFIGKISVQIKGKSVTALSTSNISYSFKVIDLNNYLKDGGVILFVVEILDALNCKVFYASLLPLDIKDYLSNIKASQKSVSVKLQFYSPLSANNLDNICHNFIINKNLQYSTISHYQGGLNRMKALESYEKLMFRVATVDTSLKDYIFGNGIYLYGRSKDTEIPVPIIKMHMQEFSRKIKNEIIINSKKYFDDYSITISQDKECLNVGKGVVFDVKNCRLDFTIKGSMRERQRDLQFLYDFIRDVLKDTSGAEIEMVKELEDYKEQINAWLESINEVSRLMHYFHIEKDFEMDGLSNEDYYYLDLLVEVILYNKKIKVNSLNIGKIVFSVGNLHIAIYSSIDPDGNANIENFFGENMMRHHCCYKSDMTGEEMDCSPYIILKADDMAQYDNFNFEIVERSIKYIPLNEAYAAAVVFFILELIKVYDNNAKKRFLELALSLCEWLLEFDQSAVNIINRCQIIKRERPLNSEEKELLMDLRTTQMDSIRILCAIGILLENWADYEHFFKRLTPEEKEAFVTYPIFRLIDSNRK